MTINRKELFGTQGFRIQRNNPDGTKPTPIRMLGTSGGIDITGIAGTENVAIKEDSGAEDDQVLDITGGVYVDTSSATVAELVTELNAANALLGVPQNWTATLDAPTGRLMFELTVPGTVGKVQLSGELISYLGFGNYSGQQNVLTDPGLKIINCFDTTKTISLAKNIKDKEEIENETADGSLTSVIKGAIVKGVTPVITVAKNDLELKQMIMGGVYDSTLNTYKPPVISEQAQKAPMNIEIFSPGYDKGSNQETNIAGWEQLTLNSVTGYEGDISKEAKSFTDNIFNMDASEYTNDQSVKEASYEEKQLTLAEYEALDILNV